MKILFVLAQAFDPNAGGVQRTTFKLGKHFTENGIEVAYFSFSKENQVLPEYGSLFHAKLSRGASEIANQKLFIQTLHNFKPDFVINQVPYEKIIRTILSEQKASVGYVLLGCLRNSLFSFKSNVADILMQQFPSVLHPVVKLKAIQKIALENHRKKHKAELLDIINKHDKFILLTPRNRDELEYFLGQNYPHDKVISIPNSIPFIDYEAEDKEKILLHVGRLNIPQKRSDLLMKVWEQCYEQLPDWKFYVIGDGPYMDTLKKDIENKKLPRVVLEGFQKPESYYKKSSIFMMPSAYEGFPNTILEAQSYGCVPFAFDSYASLGWIVNDGVDIELVVSVLTNVPNLFSAIDIFGAFQNLIGCVFTAAEFIMTSRVNLTL